MNNSVKYLLLDLDGTLIQFDLETFISKYLYLIQKCFSEYDCAISVPQWILEGTEMMLSNDGSMTNKDKFVRYFRSKSGLSEEKIWEIFLHFYKTNYNQLKRITKPIEGAKEFLEEVNRRGYQLIIATQPVFPEIAIKKRLQWAGVDHIPYQLITHIENMSVCKPDERYFTRILEKLKATPEQCLMIGNDIEMDKASEKVGIRCYLLNDQNKRESVFSNIKLDNNFLHIESS